MLNGNSFLIFIMPPTCLGKIIVLCRQDTMCHRYSLQSCALELANSESQDNASLCLRIELVHQYNMSTFQIHTCTHAFQLTIPTKPPRNWSFCQLCSLFAESDN